MNIKEKFEDLEKEVKHLISHNETNIGFIYKKLKEFKAEIEKEEPEFNPKPYELFLRLSHDKECIQVCCNGELNRTWCVGTIYKAPLTSVFIHHQETYNAWLENGSKVADQEPVEWQGGKYAIRFKVLHNINLSFGSIFAYHTGQPIPQCGDSNIARYSNDTPITGGQHE